MGIVNGGVDAADLPATAAAPAKEIASCLPIPVRKVKRATCQSAPVDHRTASDLISLLPTDCPAGHGQS